MSEQLPQEPQNDEVDLGQLFNAIGRLFERLFNFVGSIFKGIFSAIIYSIKPFVDYFKLVVIVLIVAAIVGFVLEKSHEPVYSSKMLVKPHFDSKYQLANNITYFNSLIGSGDLIELSNIFEIDTTNARQLVGFDFEAGPETENDLFLEYNKYVKSIDTSLVDQLNYKEFIQNRDLLSGSLFAIQAKSLKKDIFQDLEEGFRKTFENDFSKHQKKVMDNVSLIERETLLKQLGRLDSIQKTYLEVIKNESEKSKVSLGVGGVLPLQEEKTTTKEYELFQKEQEIGAALARLEQNVARQSTYFDVLSGFDKIGTQDNSIKQRYVILFPLLSIVILFLFFLAVRVFNFIKTYK